MKLFKKIMNKLEEFLFKKEYAIFIDRYAKELLKDEKRIRSLVEVLSVTEIAEYRIDLEQAFLIESFAKEKRDHYFLLFKEDFNH